MSQRQVARVVVAPCPPAIIPGASGASEPHELTSLRGVVLDSVRWLCEGSQHVLVLAAGSFARIQGGSAISAAPFGIDRLARLGSGDATVNGVPPVAPLVPGPAVAAALLPERPASCVLIDDGRDGLPAAQAIDADGVLVLGGGAVRVDSGSAGRSADDAEAFDAELAQILAGGDLAAVASIDLERADRLHADLPRPLQVAAALIQRAPDTASLEHHGAPFGVGYLVARWCVSE